MCIHTASNLSITDLNSRGARHSECPVRSRSDPVHTLGLRLPGPISTLRPGPPSPDRINISWIFACFSSQHRSFRTFFVSQGDEAQLCQIKWKIKLPVQCFRSQTISTSTHYKQFRRGSSAHNVKSLTPSEPVASAGRARRAGLPVATPAPCPESPETRA